MGKPDDYDLEFLDECWNEMCKWSDIDTTFADSILYLSETDDEAYELAVRWYRSENHQERKHYECLMSEVLLKNNLL